MGKPEKSLDGVLKELLSDGYTPEMVGLEYVNFLAGLDVKGTNAQFHRYTTWEKEQIQLGTRSYFEHANLLIPDQAALYEMAVKKFEFHEPRWRLEHAVYGLKDQDDFYAQVGDSLIQGAQKHAQQNPQGDYYLYQEYNAIFSALISRVSVINGLSPKKRK